MSDYVLISISVLTLIVIAIFNTKWWKNIEAEQEKERKAEEYRNEVHAFLSAYSKFLASKK